jgi:hypothetical protein
MMVGQTEETHLRWGAPVFVPLAAGVRNQCIIQFPYMGRACGVGEFMVELRDGEIQAFNYKTPFIVYSRGKIVRTR